MTINVPVSLKLSVDTASLNKIKRAVGGSFTEGMRSGIGLGGGGGSSAKAKETGLMNKMGKAFGTMGTFGLMAKGITSLGGTMKSMFKYSPAMQQSMKALETSFMLIMKPIGDFIGMILRPVSLWLLKFLMENKGIATLIGAAVTALGGIWAASKVWEGMTGAFDALKALPNKLGDVLSGLKGLGSAIYDKLSPLGDWIAGKVGALWSAGGAAISGLASALSVAWAALPAVMTTALTAAAWIAGPILGALIGKWLGDEGNKFGGSTYYYADTQELSQEGMLRSKVNDILEADRPRYKVGDWSSYDTLKDATDKGDYIKSAIQDGMDDSTLTKMLDSMGYANVTGSMLQKFKENLGATDLEVKEVDTIAYNTGASLNTEKDMETHLAKLVELTQTDVDNNVSGLSTENFLAKKASALGLGPTNNEWVDNMNGLTSSVENDVLTMGESFDSVVGKVTPFGTMLETATYALESFGVGCARATAQNQRMTDSSGRVTRTNTATTSKQVAAWRKAGSPAPTKDSGDTSSGWASYQTGGYVGEDGWKYLHQGETVTPAYSSGGGGSTNYNSGSVTVNVYPQSNADVDDLARKIAERDFQHTMRY